jgi:hypothetical protein
VRARWSIALGLVLVAASATPATAGVSFDEGSLPPRAWGTLHLRVGVEQAPNAGAAGERRHNVRVVASVPGGFVPGWCASPVGWRCSLTHSPRSLPFYTWDRDSGPAADEDVFEFAVRTPQREGEYRFPVEQRYSDGTTVRWYGPRDGRRPAPVVTVAAPPASPSP